MLLVSPLSLEGRRNEGRRLEVTLSCEVSLSVIYIGESRSSSKVLALTIMIREARSAAEVLTRRLIVLTWEGRRGSKMLPTSRCACKARAGDLFVVRASNESMGSTLDSFVLVVLVLLILLVLAILVFLIFLLLLPLLSAAFRVAAAA